MFHQPSAAVTAMRGRLEFAATTVGGGKNRERAEGLSVGEGEREPTVWEGREAGYICII